MASVRKLVRAVSTAGMAITARRISPVEAGRGVAGPAPAGTNGPGGDGLGALNIFGGGKDPNTVGGSLLNELATLAGFKIR